jgi:hypothetical protein
MAKDFTFQVPKSPTGIYTIPVGVGGGGGTSMGDLNRTPPAWVDPSVLEHFIKDYAIQGETITVSSHINHRDIEYSAISDKDVQDGIKRGLLNLLVEKLWNSNMIEFTQQRQVTEDGTMFRARIHVVPDTQVRIIREIKDARKTT